MERLDHTYLAELVEEARRGSSNAFAELYAATYQREYAYAVRVLGDTHLAQDALQDAYVRALRTISQLQDAELFVAWLNRITFRSCFDLQRRWAREASVPDEALESMVSRHGSVTPEDEAVAVDERNYLLRQVLNLPLTESQAILMRYYQSMSLAEVADMLNMSRSTVKRYIKSGRDHLRRTAL